MSFGADIEAWAKKAQVAKVTALRHAAFRSFEEVLIGSRVRTGRFRESWRIGINAQDISAEPVRTEPASYSAGDPPTQSELAIPRSVLPRVKWGDDVLITNALPYARKLEVEDGTLRRALDRVSEEMRRYKPSAVEAA